MTQFKPFPDEVIPGLWNDETVQRYCTEYGMIFPYIAQKEGSPSYGQDSAGYGIRLDNKFKFLKTVPPQMTTIPILDPRKHDDELWEEQITIEDEDHVLIPPMSGLLAQSYEGFNIPDNVLIMCISKSSLARLFIMPFMTPLEPGWKSSKLVLEFFNPTNFYQKLYIFHGVCALLFLGTNKKCKTSYGERGGRYQGQVGIVHSRV